MIMLEKKVPLIYFCDPIPILKFRISSGEVLCPYCSTTDDHFKVSSEEFESHIMTEEHIKEFCNFHCLPQLAEKMVSATRSMFSYEGQLETLERFWEKPTEEAFNFKHEILEISEI